MASGPFFIAMLARKNRLTSEKDFSRLFSKGRSVSGRFFVLRTAPNGLDVARVGFVVSTKVAKRAVLRNRLKRRMREFVRKQLPILRSGVDAAFIARSGAADLEYAQLVPMLTELLAKSGLIPRK